ncbi:MAG: DUF2914 domain-containing protein [bacterium]|nr:DUF2914 domain-containing protein [bacterium]
MSMLERVKTLLSYTRAKNWYLRYERRIASGSLLFGFIFDALTLKRVDTLRENGWIVINLIIAAVAIILINRRENKGVDDTGERKEHFWLLNLLQFSFGALLGTFVIFYFRSSSLTASWPFMLVLVGAIFANEYFRKHHSRLVFHASFFYLCLFSFSIFIVPILIHRIGAWVFFLSGLVSLAVFYYFVRILERFSREKIIDPRKPLVRLVGLIFLLFNFFYFTNLIPPIPLSLKDGGIYHSLERLTNNGYLVGEERRGFFSHFEAFPNIHILPGQSLYAYSAVFSPANLDTKIVHEWEYFDESRNRWVERGRIPLVVSGGSDVGFRTYSVRENLEVGKWRVDVATPRGQTIGRMRFEVKFAEVGPEIELKVK